MADRMARTYDRSSSTGQALRTGQVFRSAWGVEMVTYEYRCVDCGVFEEHRPMGAATESATSPCCGGDAKRVFSPPMIHQLPGQLSAMLAREEKSRDVPEVVSQPPPRPARRRAADRSNPALRGLPRR
jgi:putative FmdB family regulatory protein